MYDVKSQAVDINIIAYFPYMLYGLSENQQHLTPRAWLGNEGKCAGGTTLTQGAALVEYKELQYTETKLSVK